MKIEKTELGIKLTPETDWEKECLNHIDGKNVSAHFEDRWERKGNFLIEFDPHPWDKK